TSVVVTSDGTHLVIGAKDGTVRVVDIETGRELLKRQHADSVASMAVTRDGSRLLTGSLDKTARLWDLNTGAEVDVIRNRYEPVSAVAFSPDGSRLIISSDTNTVLDTAPLPKDYGDLVKAGKKLAPRCLTKEQHEEFHVSSPPWMTPPWCEA